MFIEHCGIVRGWRMNVVWNDDCPTSSFGGEIELKKLYI